MRQKTILIQILISAFLALLTGCGSPMGDFEAFTRPDQTQVVADNYILQPPDEIEVQCSKVPEIHLQKQQIRPDGKISFEALGEIEAAGKTPAQLSQAIYEKIITLYALTGEKPIDVRVTAYRSCVYYVLGQVYYEGPQICTGRDTLLTALAKSRPTILAWREKIKVMRPSTDKATAAEMFVINYKDMLIRGDLSKNILLQEGDIIYVPPTILASIGMVVEEIVRPIGRAFSTVNIVQGTPTGR